MLNKTMAIRLTADLSVNSSSSSAHCVSTTASSAPSSSVPCESWPSLPSTPSLSSLPGHLSSSSSVAGSHLQPAITSCVAGRRHQADSSFPVSSRGNQCTCVAYFAVVYSNVVDVTNWTPETIDLILSQGDSIYNCVAHEQLYFDYSELPLNVLLPNSDRVLSSTFLSHQSGFLHTGVSSPDVISFCDAVSVACRNSLGCLVTVCQTAVAIVYRNDSYYVFDSHSRNRLGRSDCNGTAVLLQFSSLVAIHSYLKQFHGIANDACECVSRWRRYDHDRQCQFDVVGIAANATLDTAAANVTMACPRLFSAVVSGVSTKHTSDVIVPRPSNVNVSVCRSSASIQVPSYASVVSRATDNSNASPTNVTASSRASRVKSVYSSRNASPIASTGSVSANSSRTNATASSDVDSSTNTTKVARNACLTCGQKCKSKQGLLLHRLNVHVVGDTSQQSSTEVLYPIEQDVEGVEQVVQSYLPTKNRYQSLQRLETEHCTHAESVFNAPTSSAAQTCSLKCRPTKISRKKNGKLQVSSQPPDVEPDSSSCASSDTQSSVSGAKERCNACGKFFVSLAKHKKCPKKFLNKSVRSRRIAVSKKSKGMFSMTNDGADTVDRDHSSNDPACSTDDTAPVSAEGTDMGHVTSPTKTPTRISGSTRKERMKLDINAQLKELKSRLSKSAKPNNDPLMDKLTNYHDRLLSNTDHLLTQKVSAEVKEVVKDLTQIDDARRPFKWTKEDEKRLNELNAQAKDLKVPSQWTWAAEKGTLQNEYNHKRMQYYVEHELKTLRKNCDQCKCTSPLVGIDQIDCSVCYDCMCLNQNIGKRAATEKTKAWESVRPKDIFYPQQVRTNEQEATCDLPFLYPGDKAVLSLCHPVVTVRKNFMANKKLQQVSITLRQDAQQTWCKVLPRTDLKDRYVIIERTSASHTRKHLVANPERVRVWLRYLFSNHPDFIRLEKSGDLLLSEDALTALQSQSELGEVLNDVEYDSASDSDDDSDSDDANDEDQVQENAAGRTRTPSATSAGIIQPEMTSGFSRSDVYTFDKMPYLYLRDKDFLRIKDAGLIEIIEDHQERVPIYNVSATTAFPYLYPRGEKSPLDFGDFKMSRYLLKKQTLFAYQLADAKYKWEYAEDDTHLMFQYARLVELMINANATWYLQETPDVAHLPMDDVIKAFKEGFTSDESIIDSKMPGLSSLMAKLPNSRENWFSQRLGIESMSRDLGEPNLFLTLNNDPRATYDTRAFLYQMEHGEEMPADHPYEMDTERFTELMSRFAPQMSIYLCRKTKMFMKAFLCDICGIEEKEPGGDWTKRDALTEGYYWSRVEFTETRGIQHWHSLVRLGHVLETSLLGKMIQDSRVVREELKRGNIEVGSEEAAWEIVECGLLASRYVTLFTDSISTTSFYSEHMDVDSHDASKVVDLEEIRQQYVTDYKAGNVNMATHPVMRRFCDEEFCEQNEYVEMAKVAAVSCIHNCITAVCGGNPRDGSGCRFDFPRRKLNHTVTAVMQVNATQMEARALTRRTCTRVSNVNEYMLLYWRTNHDVSVLIDGSHKMRYVTKYAAKSGRYKELLNEIIEYLSKRSMSVIPTNMRHVLTQLLLADVSHRAFMSKQELSYYVMNLPLVRRTFSDVDIVGFYPRSYLTLKSGDDRTVVYSDRTEYSAYAERCSEKTHIVNRKNAAAGNILTRDMVASMNFRQFAETLVHEWNPDKKAGEANEEEQFDELPKRRVLSRDVNSGHWVLKRRVKRRHIRFSTVLYTDKACLYEPQDYDDSTSFFSLELDVRRQLYRAYMELVCYVPWSGSPEESFLDEMQRAELEEAWDDAQRDARYSLKRLQMFFQAYMLQYEKGAVAPEGSQWRRDNQYSYSMYLTRPHNSDVHQQRVDNRGMLRARYEPDDELREAGVALRYELFDEADLSVYPSKLNFLPPDAFKELTDQKPSTLSEVSVAFPSQSSFSKMEKLVSAEKSKLFMAQPPPCSVSCEDMTAVQRWAVDMGVSDDQKVLYLCGKAGSGKTEVALKICEMMSGRVQAAAVTGKAASLLGAPTVHGMFGWNAQYGDCSSLSARKASELRAFYANVELFVIDEVNVMSAAMLAQMHQAMTELFNPNRRTGSDRLVLPFGGKRVLFLGDPAQLKPVMGEPIYGEGSASSSKPARVRGCRGKRQSQYTQTAMGQELYRNYMAPNCIMLHRNQRCSGLLQQICDKLRDGTHTQEDLDKLTCRRRKFPTFMTDYTLHYENEECAVSNIRQLWSECSQSKPADRVYICKGSYYSSKDNESVVNGLAALPAKTFNYAPDVVCVSVGCDVRLVKNLDVSAGLVNGATGTVVEVIYDNSDCSTLFAGKNPPPYCVIVNFAGFRGFVTKDEQVGGTRTYPFPNQPHWVPIYKQRFVAARSDLPSWIVKKQEMKHCYRIQFPLDLCRAMTCHRAQGQTLGDCTVSVDLGLDNPDRRLPADMCSILYVACTRVRRLQDLFVSPIFPKLWEQIGTTAGDVQRREVEKALRKAALEFASKNGKYKQVKEELAWEPDYSGCEDEWQALRDGGVKPTTRERVAVQVDDNDWMANSGNGEFRMCVRPVQSERHIGIDQGRRNFAIVAVDKEFGKLPVVVAAENYDLRLDERCKVTDVVLKLMAETELMNWMQQSDERKLPAVDRVVVHLEQISVLNSNWKQFGLKLGQELQSKVADVDRCVVQMSSPHLFRSGGLIHQLGKEIVADLNLVPMSYDRSTTKKVTAAVPQRSRKRRLEDVEPSSSAESDGELDADPVDAEVPQSAKRVRLEGVEPSSWEAGGGERETERTAAGSVQVDYKRKKAMSASIFYYFMHADADKQKQMGVGIVSELQEHWQDRIERDPQVKLDDLGDAMLHALNDVICGSSNYRQLVPSNVALTCNRTVVLAVCPDYTYWCVIYSTWNIFTIENVGYFQTVLSSNYYKSEQTVTDIKNLLIENLGVALMDMSGGDTYHSVDLIKTVVKQLKGYQEFKGKLAGALTQSTVAAAKQICDDAAGSGSEASMARSSGGFKYVRTILSTSQVLQVISSAGKLTNAILSCFNWMSVNAKLLVEKRTFSVPEETKAAFFDALCALAQSDEERLELIGLGDSLRLRLGDRTTKYAENFRRMSGYLILLGISQNEPLIKAVASSYRRAVASQPTENMSRSHPVAAV